MEYGDPIFSVRLWEKIYPEPNTGCWLWAAANDARHGYGHLGREGKTVRAHRWVMKAKRGEVVDHLCRVPSCVNPLHLEITTQRINVMRGGAPEKTRQINANKTACPRGHTYDLVVNNKGYRGCRTCARVKALRHYYAKQRRLRDTE